MSTTHEYAAGTCQCGCGAQVENRFVYKHRARLQKRMNDRVVLPDYCPCGSLRDKGSRKCGACRRAARIEAKRRYLGTDHGKAKTQAFLARTKPQQSAYQKAWRERHADVLRPRHRAMLRKWTFKQALAKYELTEARYHELAASGCALCGGPETVAGRRLSIDHDHATGKFRGLLCGVCNTRLGWFERRRAKIEVYTK